MKYKSKREAIEKANKRILNEGVDEAIFLEGQISTFIQKYYTLYPNAKKGAIKNSIMKFINFAINKAENGGNGIDDNAPLETRT